MAEFAAAMIGATLGFATSLRPDHVEYVASWRGLLADGSDHVMRAIAEAERAARYVLEADFRSRCSRNAAIGPKDGAAGSAGSSP